MMRVELSNLDLPSCTSHLVELGYNSVRGRYQRGSCSSSEKDESDEYGDRIIPSVLIPDRERVDKSEVQVWIVHTHGVPSGPMMSAFITSTRVSSTLRKMDESHAMGKLVVRMASYTSRC